MGTRKAARASCAILAHHNKMQVIQEKMANSISYMHKVGKKMLLTGITEFYQTGVVLWISETCRNTAITVGF